MSVMSRLDGALQGVLGDFQLKNIDEEREPIVLFSFKDEDAARKAMDAFAVGGCSVIMRGKGVLSVRGPISAIGRVIHDDVSDFTHGSLVQP